MRLMLRLLRYGLYLSIFCVLVGIAAAFGTYAYLAPKLPNSSALRDVQFQVPLRVYSQDGLLIAEFGEKRRIPVSFKQVPDRVIQAYLAAEDDRFFQHPGVDYQGLMRAAWSVASTGERSQGGSTITMQVARNFFLSREKTYQRKLNEIVLALKMERELSKEEILELYLNKIYLGNRAYGVGAAAQVYYGLPLDELTLAQVAMLAGLPKAPSTSNPIANPERALQRRNYVLDRMKRLGYIDQSEYVSARAEGISARLHAAPSEIDAPYVAEMVRAEMLERFGEDAYIMGLVVKTTVDSRMQAAADLALRRALLEYDRRHGWRGAEAKLDPDAMPLAEQMASLSALDPIGGLQPAMVVELQEKSATVVFPSGERGTIPWEGLSWAQAYRTENALGPEPKRAGDVVQRGDIVRVLVNGDSLELSQLPEVQGGFVALDPRQGAIRALVGGFDFFASKFNRVIQAQRQPGSSFKPFLYSAALDAGYTAATLISDTPIVVEDASLEGDWKPQNYSRKFYGPTRLREALYRSRNLVSIRLLRDIGIDYARTYVTRFGFPPDALPANLSMALGSGALTPMQIATGFAVFANGGYRVHSHLIERIETADGRVLDQPVVHSVGGAEPNSVAAERALSEPVAYIMRSILKDVVRRGTATKALKLGRKDIGGKTGTTNDQMDAWFSGFNSGLVATAWVGFDQLKPLGRREAGSVAALPMWMYFMETALDSVPEVEPSQPPGVVERRIDLKTGRIVASDNRGDGTSTELFAADNLPNAATVTGSAASTAAEGTAPQASEESLF